jgi:hypothetical protein
MGAVLALIGVRALTSLVPVQLPPWMQVHLDDRAAFVLAAAV